MDYYYSHDGSSWHFINGAELDRMLGYLSSTPSDHRAQIDGGQMVTIAATILVRRDTATVPS